MNYKFCSALSLLSINGAIIWLYFSTEYQSKPIVFTSLEVLGVFFILIGELLNSNKNAIETFNTYINTQITNWEKDKNNLENQILNTQNAEQKSYLQLVLGRVKQEIEYYKNEKQENPKSINLVRQIGDFISKYLFFSLPFKQTLIIQGVPLKPDNILVRRPFLILGYGVLFLAFILQFYFFLSKSNIENQEPETTNQTNLDDSLSTVKIPNNLDLKKLDSIKQINKPDKKGPKASNY